VPITPGSWPAARRIDSTRNVVGDGRVLRDPGEDDRGRLILDNDSDRAALERDIDELVPVAADALDRDEHIAWLDLARVAADSADWPVRVADHPGRRHTVE
jgi:hypothetical protein